MQANILWHFLTSKVWQSACQKRNTRKSHFSFSNKDGDRSFLHSLTIEEAPATQGNFTSKKPVRSRLGKHFLNRQHAGMAESLSGSLQSCIGRCKSDSRLQTVERFFWSRSVPKYTQTRYKNFPLLAIKRINHELPEAEAQAKITEGRD